MEENEYKLYLQQLNLETFWLTVISSQLEQLSTLRMTEHFVISRSYSKISSHIVVQGVALHCGGRWFFSSYWLPYNYLSYNILLLSLWSTTYRLYPGNPTIVIPKLISSMLSVVQIRCGHAAERHYGCAVHAVPLALLRQQRCQPNHLQLHERWVIGTIRLSQRALFASFSANCERQTGLPAVSTNLSTMDNHVTLYFIN